MRDLHAKAHQIRQIPEVKTVKVESSRRKRYRGIKAGEWKLVRVEGDGPPWMAVFLHRDPKGSAVFTVCTTDVTELCRQLRATVKEGVQIPAGPRAAG